MNMENSASEQQLNLQPGDRVSLAVLPPYFKTADPMPMLRPPDLVNLGEIGVVMEMRAGGTWAVKFKLGVFLMDEKYLTIPSTTETEIDRLKKPL